MEDKIMTYGGQAVIEGVMMRGQKAYAVAMRAPDGKIVVHTEKLAKVYRSGIAKIPFLRGSILLWDALGLGMKALTLSANTQSGEDEKLEGASLYLTLGLSLAFGIGLFFLLPAAIGGLTDSWLSGAVSSSGGILPAISNHPVQAGGSSLLVGNIVEGVLRLGLFIGYIWAISFMSDVKRLFMYHGAEHKTINAYEAGAELTPENVAKYPIEHARCGTAFLLTLILLSILVFSALGPMSLLWRLVTRILFIPILAGVAVEFIRWTANHLDNPVVQWIIKPNLAMQKLTTRNPDLEMIAVAIESFNAMRKAEAAAD